jgi:hypothetical protein
MSISEQTSEHAAVDAADDLRADIAGTRAELADTLDRLMAKTDVKARARRRLTGAKARAQGQLTALTRQARAHRVQLAIGGAAAVLSAAVVVVTRRRWPMRRR